MININWYTELIQLLDQKDVVYFNVNNQEGFTCSEKKFQDGYGCHTCKYSLGNDCLLVIQLGRIKRVLPILYKTHPEIFV